MSLSRVRPLLALLSIGALAACSAEATNEDGQSEDDATSFTAPAEGSCEAKAMLEVANGATLDALDDAAKLTSSTAKAIVAARPIGTIADLDAVSSVGPSALKAILAFADVSACTSMPSTELGVISDLDDTVVPKATPDLSIKPFPGIKALYHLLDERQGGKNGDVYYVTARSPERVTEIPDYLSKNGIPAGPIETGTSGAPFIARPEKVKDIESIFAKTGSQRFVFFGDTANVDPEVQRDILTKHPERMVAGIIHKVTATIAPARVAGLHLVNDYAEAAAVLYGLKVITKAEAQSVMDSAKAEGLDITAQHIKDLLASPPL